MGYTYSSTRHPFLSQDNGRVLFGGNSSPIGPVPGISLQSDPCMSHYSIGVADEAGM